MYLCKLGLKSLLGALIKILSYFILYRKEAYLLIEENFFV